jgi:integrase
MWLWQGDCGSHVKKSHDTTLTASASVEGSSIPSRNSLVETRQAAAMAPFPSLLRLREALILDSSSGTKRDEYIRYGLRIAQWAKMDPADITQDQVTAFFIELKVSGRYAANTIGLMTAALRYLFLKVLRREGWDIFLKLRSPDVKRLPFVLTVPQCQALIAHTRLLHFRLLWELILGTGLRVSEAVGLEVTSIRGKGNKERSIPLPPLLYWKLRDYWFTHKHPRWVFPLANGAAAGDSGECAHPCECADESAGSATCHQSHRPGGKAARRDGLPHAAPHLRHAGLGGWSEPDASQCLPGTQLAGDDAHLPASHAQQ